MENIINNIKKREDDDNVVFNNEIYTYLDSGLTRKVYLNEDRTKVVKILIDNQFNFNKSEFDTYNNSSDDNRKQMAETFLSKDGFYVIQEFVENVKFSSKQMTMKQILFSQSCRNEVGWTTDGRLVCFDLDEYKKY